MITRHGSTDFWCEMCSIDILNRFKNCLHTLPSICGLFNRYDIRVERIWFHSASHKVKSNIISFVCKLPRRTPLDNNNNLMFCYAKLPQFCWMNFAHTKKKERHADMDIDWKFIYFFIWKMLTKKLCGCWSGWGEMSSGGKYLKYLFLAYPSPFHFCYAQTIFICVCNVNIISISRELHRKVCKTKRIERK